MNISLNVTGGVVMKARNKAVLDSRIEEFCKTSSALLEGIHARCSDKAGPEESGKKKRGRKKKAKKEQASF